MDGPGTPEAGSCPLCGEDGARPWRHADGYEYVRCAGCGAARLDPMPTVPEQRGRFDRAYFDGGAKGGYLDYDADEDLHRRNAKDRLRTLAEACPSGSGTLLDVGCATGYLLDEARRAGWTVAGVEVSAWARGEASRRFGLAVHPDLDRAVAASPGAFDAVTFFQVLEHMADPLKALQCARTLLKPGGALVVETWDAGSLVARLAGPWWQQVNPPTVTYLFDRRSLARLSRRAGFEGLRIRCAAKQVRVAFALHLVSGRLPSLAGPMARVAERTGLDRAAFRYRLCDLVTVVAKVPGEG